MFDMFGGEDGAGLTGAGMALVGAAGLAMGGYDTYQTNATNKEIAEAQMKFQGEQAAIGRDFNAAQAQLARDFAQKEAGINRNFNADEARAQRAWLESMSNSAVQRSVDDYRKAGINPLLAVPGGASTPAGSAAVGQPAQAATATSGGNPQGAGIPAIKMFSDAASSSISLIGMLNQAEKLSAETSKIRAEADIKKAEVPGAVERENIMSDITKETRKVWESFMNWYNTNSFTYDASKSKYGNPPQGSYPGAGAYDGDLLEIYITEGQ